MLYLILILLIAPIYYSLSYARYNWKRKNKKAAFGMIVLVAASVILPVVASIVA